MNAGLPTGTGVLSDRPLLELEHATIGYDGDPVLRDVNLTVRSGDIVAVLGANGSGKSTLIRGVLGLAQLQSGSIRLFGTPAQRFGERWRLGYVPQRSTVAGALPTTVREIVTSGRLPRRGLGRRLQPADTDAVERALATVDLSALASTPIAHLSGGQQRRVTIARALAAEPDLLILDEPTAGVDAESQVRLADTLDHLRELGTTIVLIAHEVGPVAHLIERVVVMRDGGIVFDGPAREHHDDHSGHRHLGVDEHHDLADDGCEHLHDHGEPPAPPRPGTGLRGW